MGRSSTFPAWPGAGRIVRGAAACLVVGLLAFDPAPATAQEEFEEWLEERQSSYQEFSDQVTREYREYYREQIEAFEAYKDSIAARWGREQTKTSRPASWVGYDEDFSARRSIDFKEGRARASVLLPTGQADDTVEVRRRLRQEVQELATSRGESPHLQEEGPAPDQALLAGQVETAAGEQVDSANATEFARGVVENQEVERQKVEGEDGQERVATSVEFRLVPDHVRERAGQFRDLIQEQAARFELSAPLVFAVTHTESWYNPRARSSAPAYGLMQLVPESGARTAYLQVYQEDRILKPPYLYRPPNNVELGAAYLDFLYHNVFEEVERSTSRLYCAVAAYNTGPANVARTFNDAGDVSRAIRSINELSPGEVYARLREDLPYKETREYIRKVKERMPMYREWKLSP